MSLKKIFIVALAVSVSSASLSGMPSDTLRASDYGLMPDTYENCVAQLNRIMDICRSRQVKVLLLEPGRYDIWPEGAVRRDIYVSNTSTARDCPTKEKTLGLLVDNQENLTVDGRGAALMFHGKQTMVAVIGSKGIVIQNLSIDLERPAGSELTVERCDRDGTVDIRLHRDSRYAIGSDGRLVLIGEGWKSERTLCIEYCPENDHFTGSEGWRILERCQAEELEPGLVRFKVPDAEQFTVGHTMTIRDIKRDQVGILNLESEDITYRNVKIHYMNGIGMVSQFCTGITIDSVWCAPRPGSGRVLACSADFLHFSGCRGSLKVLGSYFCGAHDDPINVHGTYLRIISDSDSESIALRAKRKLRVKFMHPESYGFRAFRTGDTVAFVHPRIMQRYAEAVVVSAEAEDEYHIGVVLDRELPEGMVYDEDVLENMTWTPEVEVRGNYFTHTHTRGTLMTTPRKVVIADNTYCRTGMAAILISGEALNWFESGTVRDVLIQGNRFIDCGYNNGSAVISIEPGNTIIDEKHPAHRNIRIIGNTFETFGNAALYAKSVGGLVFRDNTVRGVSGKDAVVLDGCGSVTLKK